MTIVTNYGTLKTSMAARMNRTDLTAELPGFVQRAEEEFNRILRHPKMITTNAAYAVGTGASTALPTDLIEPISIVGTYAGSKYEWEYDGALGALALRGDTAGATPIGFRIEGTSIVASPPLSSAMTTTLNYYAKFTTITSGDSAANWLLTDHSGLYLYRSLMEAAVYLRDAKRLKDYGDAFQGALDSFQRAGRKYRQAVGMRVRAV